MFPRVVFVLAIVVCISAQSDSSLGNAENTARLNVVFPQLDLNTDNNVGRRQLHSPMVDPSGLQPKETNSLRLLQLQMDILRMQDLVKKQLAENGRAEVLSSTTTTTTEATTKSSAVTEDNATRLGRLLESLGGSNRKNTGGTFELDGIQDEIESLQRQLGRITASRARTSNGSKSIPVVNNGRVREIKKTPRISYFDMPAEASKARSNSVANFRSRDTESYNDYNEIANENARAGLPPSLFGGSDLGIKKPESLESQLLKYQESLNKYTNPKYTSMFDAEFNSNLFERKHKPIYEYGNKHEKKHHHSSHSHKYDDNDDEKYEPSHEEDYSPNYSNPITSLVKPVEVNVGGVAQNALLELVLEILKLAAGGDGRGILGAVIKLPALIVRGLLKTMVSALAKDGLRGLIIKFLVPLIALIAVNVLMIFLAWWLWEDGHCDMESKETEKTYYD